MNKRRKLLLFVGLAILMVAIVISTFTIMFSNWSGAVTAISTLGIFIIAVVASFIGWRQLSEYRKRQSYLVFMDLIEKMASQRERENRAIIYQITKDNNKVNNLVNAGREKVLVKIGLFYDGQKTREFSDKEIEAIKTLRIKEAIEETVSCLNRVCFFIKDDKDLQGKAPVWFRDILINMWDKIRAYVESRRLEPGQQNYGIYFGDLAIELNKRSSNNF